MNPTLYQRHLDLAVNESKVFFRNIPKLTPQFIQSCIVSSIHRQFVSHDIPLTQFAIVQLNPNRYTVTVNKTAFATIEIEKKVCDS